MADNTRTVEARRDAIIARDIKARRAAQARLADKSLQQFIRTHNEIVARKERRRG